MAGFAEVSSVERPELTMEKQAQRPTTDLSTPGGAGYECLGSVDA